MSRERELKKSENRSKNWCYFPQKDMNYHLCHPNFPQEFRDFYCETISAKHIGDFFLPGRRTQRGGHALLSLFSLHFTLPNSGQLSFSLGKYLFLGDVFFPYNPVSPEIKIIR